MTQLKLTLPQHWACALMYGDVTGMDEREVSELDAFTADMDLYYRECWVVGCSDEPTFMKYHDAHRYGVLACDCLEYAFDMRPAEL